MSDFKNAAQKSFRQENGGVAVGLARGFVTSKLPKATRPSYRKGAKSQRIALVRSVCREVSGLSPYEKRLLDVLKVRVDAVLSSSVCRARVVSACWRPPQSAAIDVYGAVSVNACTDGHDRSLCYDEGSQSTRSWLLSFTERAALGGASAPMQRLRRGTTSSNEAGGWGVSRVNGRAFRHRAGSAV